MVDRGRGWPISMRFHRGAAAFFRSLAAREKGENAFKSDSDLDSAFPLVLQSLMRVLNKMPRETRREERGNAPPLRLLRPSVERGAGMREPEDESERRSRVLRGPHPRSAAAEEKPGTTTADDACICILNTLDISSRPTKLSASSSYSVPSFFSWFLSRNLLSRYSILLGEFSTTTVVETSAKDSKGEENLHFSNYAFRERRVALAAPTRADLPPRRLSQRARSRIKTIRDVLTPRLDRGIITESPRFGKACMRFLDVPCLARARNLGSPFHREKGLRDGSVTKNRADDARFAIDFRLADSFLKIRQKADR